MAAVTSSTFSNQYQKYFSKMLLKYAVQALKLAEFGQKAPLPTRAGQKEIRFFRYGAPSSASVQTLTEGTPIAGANYRVLSQSVIDATLVQYGQVIQLTDVLQATEFFSSMEQATKANGEDAALHADDTIRLELKTGTTKRYSGGATTFAALQALSQAAGVFAPVDALDAATQLKINRAPTINGGYVAVAPPHVTRDLMNHASWINAKSYSDVTKLYAGEVGSLYGVRFVEATNPWVEDNTEGTFSLSDTGDVGLIYSTFILGEQAFGIPELTGNSPMSPQVLISKGADKADPLDQQTNIGFKTFWVAKKLNDAYFVVHRSTSMFV